MKFFYSAIFILIFIFSSCDNPTYNSPQPGTVEIHFIATAGAFSLASSDSLVMIISQIRTTRSDGAFANIYDHVNALADYPDNVNIINALNKEMVIGQMYLPPDRFTNVMLLIGPPTLFVYGKRRIQVTTASDYDALQILPMDYKIDENQTTVIKISCNLDSMLVKRAEGYEFHPIFKIQK